MSDRSDERERSRQVDGYNAGYAEELYEGRLRRRGVIPPSLAEWSGDGAAAGEAGPTSTAALEEPVRPEVRAEGLRAAAVARALVEAHRDHGHLAVQLDPLGAPPPGHPTLKPEFYEMPRERVESLAASAVGVERLGETVGEALDRLGRVYCGSIGYELDHVENPAHRDWLVEYIEAGRHWSSLDGEAARGLLETLTRVEGLEQFLHRTYLGKKRFSVEGLDMLVPMFQELLERAAAEDTREVLIGMAHRGRLNVLAHVIGRSYEGIVAEFEGDEELGLQSAVAGSGSGDVKYHVGARGRYETPDGEIDVSIAPNPSHLEHVNPVVQGMARAARELWARGERREGAEPMELKPAERPARATGSPRAHGHGRAELRASGGAAGAALPVLVHGDAGFMGQGVAAETLNLSRLQAYETGGTIHLVANNQLGFTTRPEDGRSTRYASDLALGFRIPVVHVNADDPDACLAAVRLAVDYRSRFGEDVVVDLVGYRRYGHNEGDEPAFTQPAMYRKIDDHPTVRTQLAARLAEEGVVSEEEAEEMEDRVADELRRVRDGVVEGKAAAGEERSVAETLQGAELTRADGDPGMETAVEMERLRELNEAVHRWPEEFRPYEKLDRLMEGRKERFDEALDWAHAEALAFATLVTGGVPVRLAGEDSERGTFSQRHLVLHSEDGEGSWVPMQHLAEGQEEFQIWNSPLSEVAALGFEYGYSTIATDSLVLWEAQYGDFANVGQAIVDQFIVAGRSKWAQESRLTLLLPHGYEGQGPEHSSARLERFLQLAAEDNIRVANCTTPAQYFHLLRQQALREDRRPLVLMTPKSLLRHPQARSPASELTEGAFRPVLPDPERSPAAGDGDGTGETSRVVLCSGKLYYDLVASDLREEHPETAIVRVERLFPFPAADLEEVLGGLAGAEEVVWAQEEPENMGAWTFLRPRLEALLAETAGDAGAPSLRYAGRPPMASPAEGFHSVHERHQQRILGEAFGERSEEHPTASP